MELRNFARRENLLLGETKVTINAENAACCGGSQTFLNRLAVSCPYADKGARGQVQLRLPNLARTRRQIRNLEDATYEHRKHYRWSKYVQFQVNSSRVYALTINNQFIRLADDFTVVL